MIDDEWLVLRDSDDEQPELGTSKVLSSNHCKKRYD
jgi:hypothetical protein